MLESKLLSCNEMLRFGNTNRVNLPEVIEPAAIRRRRIRVAINLVVL